MSATLGFSFESIKSLFLIKPRRQLREMYLFLLLFSFAASLITVFEPIFFYTQGFPLWKIALFYALHYSLYVFLMPVGGMFAARFGYERALTFSTPLFVVYFLLLAGIGFWPELFWVAIIVLTLFKTLYWPAYHANFAAYTDSNNRGTELSWVQFVEYGAAVVGPVAGGVIAFQFGFTVLFLMAAALVGLAGMVLLRTRERVRKDSMEYRDPWRIIFSRSHRHMVVSMVGWGENLVYLSFWPVFLILVFNDVDTVGAVASVSALIATILGFFIGEATDRYSARRVLRWSAPYMALGYALRMFVWLPWQVVVGDVLSRTAVIGVSNPFVARLYKNAQRVGPLEYAVAFEIVLAFVKALTAFVLLAVFLLAPVSVAFIIAFALAAAMSLFYMFL